MLVEAFVEILCTRVYRMIARSGFLRPSLVARVSGGVRYTFPEEDVLRCIEQCCDLFGLPMGEARAILDEIEAHHGILERYSVDSYMFSHPSFQEYFVARNLITQRRELEVIRSNFDNEGWAGVIEFTAALLGDPGSLAEVPGEEVGDGVHKELSHDGASDADASAVVPVPVLGCECRESGSGGALWKYRSGTSPYVGDLQEWGCFPDGCTRQGWSTPYVSLYQAAANFGRGVATTS